MNEGNERKAFYDQRKLSGSCTKFGLAVTSKERLTKRHIMIFTNGQVSALSECCSCLPIGGVCRRADFLFFTRYLQRHVSRKVKRTILAGKLKYRIIDLPFTPRNTFTITGVYKTSI